MKLTLDTILVIVSGIASWLTALTGLIFGYKSWKTSKVDAAKQFMEAENSEELFKARHAIYSCKDIFKVKEIYLMQVASHYHFWGLMVKKGFLPKWIFQGEPGESALQLYDRLKPYIDKRRVDKKSYAENYSWLIEKIEQMKDVSPI